MPSVRLPLAALLPLPGHLGGDPGDGRVACADQPRRLANARSNRQRRPYRSVARCRELRPAERLPALSALREKSNRIKPASFATKDLGVLLGSGRLRG
jgi:hypothetical protein